MDLATELQRIYDSEIAVRIDWIWDGGINVALGDELGGFDAAVNVRSVEEILPWLQEAIAHFYPTSDYAKSLPPDVVERGAHRQFLPPKGGAKVPREMMIRGPARPLPDPPRCRGIEFAEGHFTGCAYGYRDWPPFWPPCDCPTCHGSGYEVPVITRLPHLAFGDPNCCGSLNAVLRGELFDLTCSKCPAVVRTIAAADLERTLIEMEISLNVATVLCPHCRKVNLLPGAVGVAAFVCQYCGRGASNE